MTALTVSAHAQQAGVATPSSKLSTVLADLVKGSSGNTLLSTSDAARPPSVRDAIQSRRLRFDANNEVQVYILMSAVTDDTLRQLTAAGVTIEISDVARRRVQAHLPA